MRRGACTATTCRAIAPAATSSAGRRWPGAACHTSVDGGPGYGALSLRRIGPTASRTAALDAGAALRAFAPRTADLAGALHGGPVDVSRCVQPCPSNRPSAHRRRPGRWQMAVLARLACTIEGPGSTVAPSRNRKCGKANSGSGRPGATRMQHSVTTSSRWQDVCDAWRSGRLQGVGLPIRTRARWHAKRALRGTGTSTSTVQSTAQWRIIVMEKSELRLPWRASDEARARCEAKGCDRCNGGGQQARIPIHGWAQPQPWVQGQTTAQEAALQSWSTCLTHRAGRAPGFPRPRSPR